MPEKIVIILGDTGGLGKAFAQAFSAAGDIVFGASRTLIAPSDTTYNRHQVDVTDEADVIKYVSYFREQAITPDIVLNCAGVMDQSLLVMSSKDNFLKVFMTNVLGAFLVNREFAKLLMPKKKGLIVNFSSIHVEAATVGSGAYASSKSAIETLTRVFSAELASTDVKSCCIALSYVKDNGMAAGVSEQVMDSVLKKGPSRRAISFEEVFQIVCDVADRKIDLTDPVLKLGI